MKNKTYYSDFYHPDDKIMKEAYGNDYKTQDPDDLYSGMLIYECIEKMENSSFHLSNMAQFQCSFCKGTNFNLGSASYETAVRCINCGLELIVHEG